MRWAGHAVRMRETRCIQYFSLKVCGKKSVGRPRRRWEDNIRMDLREIGWKVVDCTHLVQDRDQWWAVVNAVINLRVP
jgi:hypothetical protein